ncbi:MAG: TlpA family protein disulfide reductase [Gemmatimonadales bacterium]
MATALLVAAAPVAAQNSEARLPSIGAEGYAWQVLDAAGSVVALEAWRGRVVVLNLWATWCRPCVTELPSLMALRDSLQGTDVVFAAVSAEGPEVVRRFVRARQIDLPVYLERSPMPESLGVLALPTTLVIDREGRIVLHRRGAAEWNKSSVVQFVRAVADRGI